MSILSCRAFCEYVWDKDRLSPSIVMLCRDTLLLLQAL
jgi:hypothetical protein